MIVWQIWQHLYNFIKNLKSFQWKVFLKRQDTSFFSHISWNSKWSLRNLQMCQIDWILRTWIGSSLAVQAAPSHQVKLRAEKQTEKHLRCLTSLLHDIFIGSSAITPKSAAKKPSDGSAQISTGKKYFDTNLIESWSYCIFEHSPMEYFPIFYFLDHVS